MELSEPAVAGVVGFALSKVLATPEMWLDTTASREGMTRHP
jgi:hypothetical protein